MFVVLTDPDSGRVPSMYSLLAGLYVWNLSDSGNLYVFKNGVFVAWTQWLEDATSVWLRRQKIMC